MHTQSQQIVRAEIARELTRTVAAIQKTEGLSFKKAWEVAKKKHRQIFAQAARVEDGIVEAADEAFRRRERILTAEAPMLAQYGLRPEDVPEPYRSDPWYH